jgi:hypothetical protein
MGPIDILCSFSVLYFLRTILTSFNSHPTLNLNTGTSIALEFWHELLDTVQADRLKVYYGEDDGWCPLGHRDNILMVSLFNKYYISTKKSLKVFV